MSRLWEFIVDQSVRYSVVIEAGSEDEAREKFDINDHGGLEEVKLLDETVVAVYEVDEEGDAL